MCTVSFIPCAEHFIFTSNRDEHLSRAVALAPQVNTFDEVTILFPKDAKAGGTWFAANQWGHVCVLLNGGFVKHTSTGNYAKSRGLVLLDIAKQEFPTQYYKSLSLQNIEPFTVIVFENKNLTEFRWDGEQKHEKKLSLSEAYIWSSATLYSPEVIALRAAYFKKFLEKNDFSSQAIIDFHTHSYLDKENGFVIDRNTQMKTFSVTQAVRYNHSVAMKHLDLIHHKNYQAILNLKMKNSSSLHE